VRVDVYILRCPSCGLLLEVTEEEVGKPPFVAECPECGGEVESERIIAEEALPPSSRGR